ncbi:hypothetical protein [Numidum massiliense]|uniref:hypothetical protein n=1 Tax=Numidum massiliense TaxID=1522315 RepID=UPI0006D53EF8|nr:hypothetical protein [Numidum massiliense]
MKKIRLLPAVLSLVITGSVLFGGWFFYEVKTVKQPLRELLVQEKYVTHYEIDVTPKTVAIELNVTPSFLLSQDYIRLLEQAKEMSGREHVTITLKDKPNARLYGAWSELYFLLAEGVETSDYYTMQERIEKHPATKSVETQVALDADHLYVWLQDASGTGKHSLFRTLPMTVGENRGGGNG